MTTTPTAAPTKNDKPPKTLILNITPNDIRGNVKFGQGCIINPSSSIVCQDKSKQLVFGDYNIIEEKAIILVKNNCKIQSPIIKIGSYNIFGIRSYVTDCQLGDCNVLQPNTQLRQTKLGNNNIVGSQLKLTKTTFKDGNRFFYPGKIKTITPDIFDPEKHKQMIRSTYIAMTENNQ